MEPDFSGYATKAGLKCSDGRTIMPDAFKHQDKVRVPLVWQHGITTPENVLGHAILENRSDGVYAYAFFNKTAPGQHAKSLVEHGDIDKLSILANQLIERSKQVIHGMIREVSLVIAGANPGAKIDHVRIAHSDGDYEELEDEAVIHTGLTIEHDSLDVEEEAEGEDDEDDEDDEAEEPVIEHAEDSDDAEDSEEEGPTVQEVYASMTKEQQEVTNYMVGVALEAQAENSAKQTESAEHSENNTEGDLTHQEGIEMTRNVFETNGAVETRGPVLSHDQISTLLADAKKPGMTLKDSFLAHAGEFGIDNIELLFPDAKALQSTPEFLSRRMEWVAKVLDGTKHIPFSKIKTLLADITAEEARAKGYVKGERKVEEVFSLLKRETGPATIYKKQKLDRDDIVDVTDLDVVAFLKGEMRLMIEEEIARAVLVGDGRSPMHPDKVKDPMGSNDGSGIRSILNDDDLYAVKATLAANVSPKDAVKGLVRARTKFRGSGKPTLFISDAFLTDIMLEEDRFGRPLYATEQELADKVRVESIVGVDLFEEYAGVVAIMVYLNDYSIGSTRGGELTSFEDFDIDFNQHKYLQETRLSGGLTKPYSAIVVTRAQGTKAVVEAPSYDGASNTITIPEVTGVVYLIDDEVRTGDVVIDRTTEVEAVADNGYYIEANTTRHWTFSV